MQPILMGKFQEGDSLLHKLDPRTRLICAGILIVAIFAVHDVLAIVIFLALTVAFYPLAHIPVMVFLLNMKNYSWLYLITFLIHLLFGLGEKIIHLPILGGLVSGEGMLAGVLFTIRIASLISLFSLLLMLTTAQDITDSLERLLRPLSRFGLPIGEWALTLALALRFIPVLLEEGEKVRRAQISRGSDLEGIGFNWIKRLHRLLPLIIPMFAGAQKRADDLALALEARAYRGGKSRTRMTEMRLLGRDFAALGVACSVAVGFWIWR
jgi:energy-coupling factor transport system permease protein